MTISNLSLIRGGADVATGNVPLPPYAPPGPIYRTTSASSLVITNAGARVFTVASKWLNYSVGARARAVSASSGDWMEGLVIGYTGTTLTILMDTAFGSGTYSDWIINIVGERGDVNLFSSAIVNAKLVETRNNGVATFAIKTLGGNDPSPRDYVSMMTPNGGALQVISPVTLSLPYGSSFGVVANTPFRIWFVLINQVGVGAKLAVIQCRNGTAITSIPSNGVVNAAAIGPVTQAGVFYSNGSSIAQPFCILGYAEYDSGLATAGVWNVAPDRIVLYSAGMPLPGDVIQTVNDESYFPYATTTAVIDSGTWPYNSEGAQFMSIDVTPLSNKSVFHLQAEAMHSSLYVFVYALFKSLNQPEAMCANWSNKYSTTVNTETMVYLATRNFFGSLTTHTISYRAGNTSADTLYFNGSGGAQFYGGAAASHMLARELMT